MRQPLAMLARWVKLHAPFVVWVLWFLSAWLVLVLSLDLWDEIAAHWEIAVAMLFGSYVAGSTPMGGGTVGFPILVFGFGETPTIGRQFSFAIQSVGMTSAAIYIFAGGHRVALRLLAWAALASAVSLPATLVFLAPIANDEVIKLVFACVWAGFGVMTLVKLKDLLRSHHLPRLGARADATMGIAAGLLGGVVAGLTGVGIDMVVYTVLVLLYRADMRIAIATSVVIMAINSVMGSVYATALGRMTPEVFYNWAAAAPVVLFGAPLGALMMRLIPKAPTMVFVALLCVAQLVWAVVNVGAGWIEIVSVAAAVLVLNGAFHMLDRLGRRLVDGSGASTEGEL